jgi:hypothetical protein
VGHFIAFGLCAARPPAAERPAFSAPCLPGKKHMSADYDNTLKYIAIYQCIHRCIENFFFRFSHLDINKKNVLPDTETVNERACPFRTHIFKERKKS